MITLVPGLIVEKHHNDQITVVTIETNSRQMVDMWYDETVRNIESAPTGTPFFTLYDFTHKQAGFTNYGRQRIEEIIEKYPDITGYTAIILPNNILVRLFRYFVEPIIQRRQRHVVTRIFFEREVGLVWLVENYEKMHQHSV